MANPKVSVITITYNQDRYIREALDSFIAQKTNFDFEVIVADDASTDSTPEIIREYAKQYPDKIKPIFRNINIGAVANSLSTLRSAKGTYIALCEGDDYWIDINKLQKQVDFLDSNPDHVICFHKTRVVYENGEENTIEYPGRTSSFTLAKLIEENYIPTCSVMYRSVNYADLSNKPFPLDWYLHLYHAKQGKIGFIKDTMSVYRRHKDGIWWAAYESFDNYWKKYGANYLFFQEELIMLYGANKNYLKIIHANIYTALRSFIRIDLEQKTSLFSDAMETFPQLLKVFFEKDASEITKLKERVSKLNDLYKQDQATITELNNQLIQKSHQYQQLASSNRQLLQRMSLLENSRTWKVRTLLIKMLGRENG